MACMVKHQVGDEITYQFVDHEDTVLSQTLGAKCENLAGSDTETTICVYCAGKLWICTDEDAKKRHLAQVTSTFCEPRYKRIHLAVE